jgi:hypothetical protein
MADVPAGFGRSPMTNSGIDRTTVPDREHGNVGRRLPGGGVFRLHGWVKAGSSCELPRVFMTENWCFI